MYAVDLNHKFHYAFVPLSQNAPFRMEMLHFCSELWGIGHCGICDIGLFVPTNRLNKKDGLTRYGDSHVKDKTS